MGRKTRNRLTNYSVFTMCKACTNAVLARNADMGALRHLS